MDSISTEWGFYCLRSSRTLLGFFHGKEKFELEVDAISGDVLPKVEYRVLVVHLNSDLLESKGSRSEGSTVFSKVLPLGSNNWQPFTQLFVDAPEATTLDLHDFIQSGIPRHELVKTFRTFPLLNKDTSMCNVLGASGRTLQRMEADGEKNLSTDQASKLISFVKIMSIATNVMGGKQQAEDWLQRKAIALEQRRPIDLMTTDIGAQTVQTLLEQIDSGVYV
jgi:putative toxin-antitoxin system antitoxin component (TIGR02293 family)